MNETKSAAEAVNEQRIATYGDPIVTMKQLGLHITAILQAHYQIELPHVIPPHVAASVMVALKLHRQCTPFARKDNDDYVDLANYISYAEQSNPNIPHDADEALHMEVVAIRGEGQESKPNKKAKKNKKEKKN